MIRPARASDVECLQKLNSEVFEDNFKYDPDLDLNWSHSENGKKYYDSATSDKNAVCLVAEDDGVAAGYLSAGPKDEVGRKSTYFEIYDMGVSPSHRSKGIGKKLVEECFKIAKSRGFQKVFVRVYFDNEKALEFYKRSGLKEIEVGLERVL